MASEATKEVEEVWRDGDTLAVGCLLVKLEGDRVSSGPSSTFTPFDDGEAQGMYDDIARDDSR